MHSMKTSGGLTQWRIFNSSILIRWLFGTLIASAINEQVEKLANTFHLTSEQHVDHRDSRIKNDKEHTVKRLGWLKVHNPFPQLKECSAVVVGNEKVNCYKAQEVGQQIMKDKIGEHFNGVKLRRNNRVITLESANRLTIQSRDYVIPIDPLFLFQRIMLKVKKDEELK